MFVPHDVPFALFPVSAQTTTPVTHDVVPVLHRSRAGRPRSCVQMPHVPLLHTMFVPQDVPFARFRLVSAQAIGLQACVPAWHGFAGVQAMPSVHDMQTPELHTMFVPQVVPLATLPVSAQTGAPVLHADRSRCDMACR